MIDKRLLNFTLEDVYPILSENDQGIFFVFGANELKPLFGDDLSEYVFQAYARTVETAIILDDELIDLYGTFKISRSLASVFEFDENGEVALKSLDYWVNLCYTVARAYGNKWRRLFETLFAEYSPIENYNMVEDENVGSKVVVSNENSSSSTGDQTNGTYGFDSSSAVPTNEGNTKVTSDGESTTTSEGKFDDNHRKLTRHGNVGVTTNQTMALQEITLRKNRIIDIIISDVADFLTRPQF